MKRATLVVAAIAFFCTLSNAQYNGVEVRFNTGGTIKGEFPFPTGSSGIADDLAKGKGSLFSMDIIGYYGLSETTSGRVRLGYRSLNAESSFTAYDVNGYEEKTAGNVSNTTLTIAPGLTRNFSMDKLTFLTTVELPFAILGKTTGEFTYTEKDNGGQISDERSTATVDGGISIGLNGVAGFRYNIAGPVLVGLDVSMGYGYIKMKGTATSETFDFGTSIDKYEQDFNASVMGVTPLSGSLVIGCKF